MAVKKTTKISIVEPNFQKVKLKIVGDAPIMTHKFSKKVAEKIEAKQTSKETVARKRDPKDYKAEFNGARYVSSKGWDGFPASALRNAMIAACRHVEGLQMTKAKGIVFIEAQGYDREKGEPLVRIQGCKPVHDTRPARLESGVCDLRNRPRYDGWFAEVTIEFDADTMTATDVANLLVRAGKQVGLCEGRPNSSNSNGIGFGTFRVEGLKQKRAA